MNRENKLTTIARGHIHLFWVLVTTPTSEHPLGSFCPMTCSFCLQMVEKNHWNWCWGKLHANKDDLKITWCDVTMKTIVSQPKKNQLALLNRQTESNRFVLPSSPFDLPANKLIKIEMEKLNPRNMKSKSHHKLSHLHTMLLGTYFPAINWTLAHTTFCRCRMNLKEGGDIYWIQKKDSDMDKQGKTYRLLQVPPPWATTKKE